MSSPCNNLNVVPIKVSQLSRYESIDTNDFFLTVESGSALYSRKSTFGDLVNALSDVTGSYSGSFSGSFNGIMTGSFTGSFKGKSSGSFSGSYWGSIISKNTKATGSFSGVKSKLSGSFSGSYWGSIVSKNIKATGSFIGNLSGSFSGSILSKNTKATGSFSGVKSKLSGSFSGSYWGSIVSKNTKATGSFSGSHYGTVIGSKGSLITGSFRGIDNITNFKGTGKKVSFNGTASYAVSSSFSSLASTASYITDGGVIFSNGLINTYDTSVPAATGTDYTIGTLTVPAGKTLKWFRIEGSVGLYEGQQFYLYGLKIGTTLITNDVYSSWGWGHFSRTGDESDNDFGTRCQFTIEGKPTSGTNSGTLVFYVNGTPGQGPRNSGIYGYVVGYY